MHTSGNLFIKATNVVKGVQCGNMDGNMNEVCTEGINARKQNTF